LFVQGIYSRYKQVEWNAEYIQRKYWFNLTDRVLCASHGRSEMMLKKNSIPFNLLISWINSLDEQEILI
jgi:hypothetical protein